LESDEGGYEANVRKSEETETHKFTLVELEAPCSLRPVRCEMVLAGTAVNMMQYIYLRRISTTTISTSQYLVDFSAFARKQEILLKTSRVHPFSLGDS
jgi:hypothetical protein